MHAKLIFRDKHKLKWLEIFHFDDLRAHSFRQVNVPLVKNDSLQFRKRLLFSFCKTVFVVSRYYEKSKFAYIAKLHCTSWCDSCKQVN